MIKSIFKGLLNFGAQAVLQLVTFLVGIYCAKTLGKAEFGALSLIKTLFQYSTFTALGVSQAIIYTLPQLIAKKNEKELRFNHNLLFTVSFSSSIFIVVFLIFFFLKIPLNGVQLSIHWIFIGVIILLSSLTGNSISLYRSHQNFLGLGINRLIYPIFFGILTFFLLPKYQLAGYLISMLSAYSAMFVFSLNFIRDKIGFAWNFKKIIEYIKIGFPIKINTYLSILFLSIDLWVVSFFLSKELAGVYGFAMLVGTSFKLIPTVVSEFLTPRIVWFFGKKERQANVLVKPYKEIMFLFLFLGVAVAILVLVFFHFLIHLYVPKYSDALPLVFILLLGYLTSTIGSGYEIVILLGKQVRRLFNNIFSFTLVFILDIIAAVIFKNILLVAASTAIGIFVSNLLNHFLITKNLKVEQYFSFMVKFILLLLAGFSLFFSSYLLLQKIGNNFLSPYLLIIVLFITIPGLLAFSIFIKFWKFVGKNDKKANNLT